MPDLRRGLSLLPLKVACKVCGGTGRLLLPGVFCIFRPRAIEYVVRGDETPAELDRLAERGFSLVWVLSLDADGQMPLEAAAGAV